MKYPILIKLSPVLVNLLVGVLLLVFLSLQSGCASVGVPADIGRHSKPYPNAPHGVTITPNFSQWIDTGETVEAHEVRRQVNSMTGVNPRLADGSYTLVSAQWLRDNGPLAAEWFRAMIPDYDPEAWDCDNFSAALKQIINACAGRAGVGRSALVASIYAYTEYEFAQIAAVENGSHALNAIWTDEGIFVVEPQTIASGRPVFISLSKYENLIHSVDFDD